MAAAREPDTRATHRGRRRAIAASLIGAVLGTLAGGAPAQTGFDLVQLTRLLSQVKAGEASFVEKRSVGLLDRTLAYTGRLSFEAPDSFVRETLRPHHERIAVVGNQVTMSVGSRSRTLALDAVPEAAVVVEAVRGTLTGNREALERHFTAVVAGTAASWSMELVPREARLRELVASVRVAGQQSLVREVVVALADGDRSVMTITPDAPGARPPSSSASPARSGSAAG